MGETAGKDLSFPTARTKDGEAFASKLVCEEKGAATSALVAMAGKLIVFETPLSLYR